MWIRPAAEADLPQLLEIFEQAKRFMAAHGNPRQWGPDYPGEARMRSQIADGVCYIVEEGGAAVGTFCCLPGAEPSYAVIEGGAWPDDAPYLTIHRLASNGKVHGVAKACFAFCAARGLALRIDTHRDNTVMQDLLNRYTYSLLRRHPPGRKRRRTAGLPKKPPCTSAIKAPNAKTGAPAFLRARRSFYLHIFLYLFFLLAAFIRRSWSRIRLRMRRLRA